MTTSQNEEKATNQETPVHSNGKKNIKIGAVLGYISFAVSIIQGLLFTPWIMKSVGDSAYGVYTVATSIINLFLLDFGLSTTTNAFLSKFRARNDQKSADEYCSALLKVYLALDCALILIFSIVYFFVGDIYKGFTPNEIELLKQVFLIIAIYSVVSFPGTIFKGILDAYEKYAFLKVVDLASKTINLILTALALSFGAGIYGLVLSHALVGLTSTIINLIYAFKITPTRLNLKKKVTWEYLKPILGFSFFSFLISIGSRFIFVITPSILGIVSNSFEAALFGVASLVEGYIFTFGSILSGMFIPSIARTAETENPEQNLQKLAEKVGKVQLFFIGLVLVGFACCGQEFVSIWLSGKEGDYSITYWLILLVSVYQLFFVPESIFSTAMMTRKKCIKPMAIFSMSRALFNLGLSFCLSYFWGAFGACLSIFIVRMLGLIAENFLYKKYLGIQLLPFFKNVYLKATLPFSLSLIVGLSLHFLLPLNDLLKFLVIGFAVVAVYALGYFAILPKKMKTKTLEKYKQYSAIPIDKNRPSTRTKLTKATIITATIIMTILPLAYGVFRVTAGASNAFGLCGQYECYATPTTSTKPELVEKFDIRYDNTLTITYFYSAGYKNETPIVIDHHWKMKYAKLKDEDHPELPERRDYQLSIENGQGGSMWQYYFDISSMSFFSKFIDQNYSGVQLEYKKI